MLAPTCLILSFIGVSHSLPAFLAEFKRDLITISPDVDLGLNLSNDNSCLGIGVSVCDPITVNSTETNTVTHSTTTSAVAQPTQSASSDNGLLDVSPDLNLDLGLSNENSCLGIGISACDPITVGSDVTKTVNEGDSTADDENTTTSTTASATTTPTASSYPTSTTGEKASQTSSAAVDSSSSSSSKDSGLLDLSPTISPDLNLNNDNSCEGIGISACDPITVDSIVNNTVNH
ncbi:hypothetical protein M426DRAFT_319666 [Hypoxylon sp. CI-4A]|nr:hypothetical protein M426DRAFT_319666 [Hypoxylon sp. CI-4A]